MIHYTADDFDSSLATLTDKNVSSHYLIPAKPPTPEGKPRIWQLVPESELAWHAGISFWRGTNRINDTSVGIELENRGWLKTAGVKHFTPFEPAQIAALIRSPKTLSPATTLSRRTSSRTLILPPSVKTIPARCSPGANWRSRELVPGPIRTASTFISMDSHAIRKWTAHCYSIC